MELSKLKWVKNVRPDKGKGWAHKEASTEIPFYLGWRHDNKKNAEKPCKGELIVLKQKAKVTHIVELLDDEVHDDKDPNGWRFRFVRLVWIPPSTIKNWDTLPHQKELFGFDIL